MEKLSSDQTGLVLRLLQASSMRSQVIANNIANENTPGFTRQVVRFEESLRDAMKGGSDDLLSIEPEVAFDEESQRRPDGNNVSLEAEMSALRENRLLYETYSAILQGQMRLMEASITTSR
jgi:flagellar basal-body rod protein FlgB